MSDSDTPPDVSPCSPQPSFNEFDWEHPKSNAESLLLAREDLATTSETGECATCSEVVGLKCAHVLPRSEEILFLSYRTQGLLPGVDDLDSLENLILLSPNCRSLYDSPRPKIAIIPDDLNFFIDWEERDYRTRQDAINEEPPRVLPRSVPTAYNYDNICSIVVITQSMWLKTRLLEGHGSRKCRASPTALILKAGMAMGVPLDLPAPLGFPAEVRIQLSKLLNLYQRPPPQMSTVKGASNSFTTQIQSKPQVAMPLLPPGNAGDTLHLSTDSNDIVTESLNNKRKGDSLRSEGLLLATRSSMGSTGFGVGQHEDDEANLFGPHMSTAAIISEITGSKST